MVAKSGLSRGRYGLDLDLGDNIPEAIQSLLQRRVIRKYKNAPLTEETLNLLLLGISHYDERAHARFSLPPAEQRHIDKYGVLDKCTRTENAARQLSLPGSVAVCAQIC